MPLEQYGTSPVYIGSLNDAWPATQDPVRQGYQHLQLIKTALKLTFPNLSAAVTLTPQEWEDGTVPRGSVMGFYQATAPVGWTRVGPTQSAMLRVIPTADATGGQTGGSMDPTQCEFIPAHSHSMSGATAADASGAHTHPLVLSLGGEIGSHDHSISITSRAQGMMHYHNFATLELDPAGEHAHEVIANAPGVSGAGRVVPAGSSNDETLPEDTWVTGEEEPVEHIHGVVFTTASNAASKHTHTLTGDTGEPDVSSSSRAVSSTVHTHTAAATLAARAGTTHSHALENVACGPVVAAKTGNWRPRAMEFIVCQRY